MRKLFDFSKLLEGSSMNAEEAYSVATYNEVVTQEIILKRFISTTDSFIKAKSENNYFSLVMDLTSQKANLLIELINSDNGAVDDSEDALLEELAVCEDLDGLKIDDSFRNKFPDYFE